MNEPEQVVRDFCAAWKRRDLDEFLGYFADNAVYHNTPMVPVQGLDAIWTIFELFVTPADEIDWDVRNLASTDGVVLTERVDRFVIGDKNVELPVAGVFEVRDGRIAAWRDYFDMQTWTRQLAE